MMNQSLIVCVMCGSMVPGDFLPIPYSYVVCSYCQQKNQRPRPPPVMITQINQDQVQSPLLVPMPSLPSYLPPLPPQQPPRQASLSSPYLFYVWSETRDGNLAIISPISSSLPQTPVIVQTPNSSFRPLSDVSTMKFDVLRSNQQPHVNSKDIPGVYDDQEEWDQLSTDIGSYVKQTQIK